MKLFLKLGLLIFVVSALFTIMSCNSGFGFREGKTISCDAESLTPNKKYFIGNENAKYLFSAGGSQLFGEAHSGKYSAVASKKNPYVLAFTIKNTGPDMFFKASVWRKSSNNSGVLVVSDKTAKRLYQVAAMPVTEGENGWEKLSIEFFTPPNFLNDDVKIYCWSNTGDSVYFDDIKIVNTQKKYPKYKEQPLVIVLDTLDYRKLMNKRIEAFNAGVLQSAENDWVKGIVFGDGKMMKAKLRLKGDWLDHLVGDKWSFRIKMRKNFAWRRLRVFSIQTPSARDYLYEWFSHQLYESKDILTTRYGFVPVDFGNKPRGLYAWEEHFTKQLIESRKRREGPILKLSEDPFWQIQRVAKVTGKWAHLPYYNVSTIEPFSQSKTLKSPTLYRQFIIASKLMNQYKYKRNKPAGIFDVDKMAKYFAMLDLTHARHGMAWHNQRFYYNPILCKLEPIAYDGFTNNVDIDFSINDNMAYFLLSHKPYVVQHYNFYYLFEDKSFLNLYLTYLKEYSSTVFVDSINRKLSDKVSYYDSLITLEFPRKHFDKEFLTKSAKALRGYLPKLEKFIAQKEADNDLHVKIIEEDNSDTTVALGTPAFFVTAYLERRLGDSSLLGVHNFFGRPIKLIGTGIKKRFVQDYLPTPEKMAPYKKGEDGIVKKLVVELQPLYLFFQVEGFDDLYSVKINPWPYPSGITPQQELMKTVDLKNSPAIDTIIGNDIFIAKGSFSIDKHVIIPKGYRVVFSPGTTIDLINNAIFLSYSPVYMKGTAEQPIVVKSSDGTGNGFTILQAGDQSVLNNVIFENLNTLNYKGWTLSGAVTFYESDATITNTIFADNNCEDALNMVRSKIVLKNSRFERTYSDAFDSDFSNGLVDGVTFVDVGNDAIDFSGSRIDVANTTIRGAQDKGVSAGEDSHFKVRNTFISGANIGLASKDLSSLDVTNSKVDSCNYGAVLLQKKPEYGPATMNLQKVDITNCKTKFLIEKGSKVIFNHTIIKGDKKKVAKMFY